MKLLRDIRVLDPGGFITGPYTAMLLADFGADVVKVERPGATRLALIGDYFDAQEMLRLGRVNQVIPRDGLTREPLALAHASHNDYREKLLRTQLDEGMKAFLQMRDGPFQPEPMGPRSAKGRPRPAKTKALKRAAK